MEHATLQAAKAALTEEAERLLTFARTADRPAEAEYASIKAKAIHAALAQYDHDQLHLKDADRRLASKYLFYLSLSRRNTRESRPSALGWASGYAVSLYRLTGSLTSLGG